MTPSDFGELGAVGTVLALHAVFLFRLLSKMDSMAKAIEKLAIAMASFRTKE